jgi:signal transduction histidine kinase/CheY-like chemotaxis protein
MMDTGFRGGIAMGNPEAFAASRWLPAASTGHAPTADRATLVHAEQVRASYRTIRESCIGAGLAGIILTVSMWGHMPTPTLLGWYSFLAAALLLLLVLDLRYRRASPAPGEAAIWERRFLLANFLHGCAWGSAGVLMFSPELTAYQMWLVLALFLIAISSLNVGIIALMPMVRSFIIPVVSPLIVLSALQQDFLHWVVAAGGLLLLGYMLFASTRMNRLIVETFNLRFENELAFRRADEANRAKTSFLAAASHDLRQPMHAMGLFVSALKDKNRDPETLPLVERLVASVNALEGLFDSLLDISKLDAGIVHAEIRDFPLQPIFERVARDWAADAGVKGLRLRFAPTRAIVRSDATLLERILRNLVSNAVRYTRKGGVLLGCRRSADGTLRIVVCDSGIGIEADQVPLIFKEFFQIANPERDRAKGLGLGLAIVDQLARLLGHSVAVASVPGRGSTFSLEVARGEALSAARPSAHAEEMPEGRLQDALIVVVDDEAAVREGMGEVLRQWGCTPLLAGSADEALALLAASGGPPRAVIADYRLREEKTGSDAIERIRAAYGAGIPGMIVTGDTAPDRLREAEASGYHLMHKPVRPLRLRALLSYLLA